MSNETVLTATEAQVIQSWSPQKALHMDLAKFLGECSITPEEHDKRKALVDAFSEYLPDMKVERKYQKSPNDIGLLIRFFLQLLGLADTYNKAEPPSAIALPKKSDIILPRGAK